MRKNKLEEKSIEESMIEEMKLQEPESKGTEMSKSLAERFFRSNIFRLLVAILILCACAGLGAGIAVVEDKSNPTEFVAGYFGKFLMQDYEGMMEYVDTSNVFVTKDSFANLMSNLRAENNIGEYEFGELEKSGDRYVMRVSYKDGETGEDKNFDIFLKKSRKGKRQLMADWKICIDDSLAADYMIQIPEGMTLEMDGVEVTESYGQIRRTLGDVVKTAEGETIVINNVEENAETSVTYKINNVIKGKHTIKATSEFTQIMKDVDVGADQQKEVLRADEATVNDEYIKLIETNSSEMIQEFYEVVRNRKTSSDKLKTYFVNDENLLKSVKKAAKKSQEIIFWPDTKNIEDYSLIQCDFSEFEYTAQYAGENKLKTTCTFHYDYVSSTDTELYESYIFSIRGRCDTTMEITYTAENGEIKISEISIKNKNKKNVEEE